MKWLSQLTKIVNTGQSRSIILTGNIHDLFFDGQKYVPLLEFMQVKLAVPTSGDTKGITQVVYQINRPVRIDGDYSKLTEVAAAWEKAKIDNKSLHDRLREAESIAPDQSIFTFELMRQMAMAFRKPKNNNKNNLLFLIEAADMLLPECEVSRMAIQDRKRVAIVQDWFTDPEFMDGHDTVIMFSESRSNLHHRIARLPSVVSVDIPLPDLQQRQDFIGWFATHSTDEIRDLFMVGPPTKVGNYRFDEIAEQTAGLSLHAIRQLLCSCDLSPNNITKKVEEYMIAQLGEGVVEFKRPTHKLADVIGMRRIKKFASEFFIPAIKATGDNSIAGAAMGGPIGGGKTYFGEAIASEILVPVILFKNIRSKWFGETDQIFERVDRLLRAFNKIVVFFDEADTMLGNIQSDHDTEKRLIGKIQAMMSDPTLLGKVIWILMTARIHLLSPDVRRPGRMDIIIPILDPEDEDKEDFLKWSTRGAYPSNHADDGQRSIDNARIHTATKDFSSASYAMLRRRIKSGDTINDCLRILEDMVSPDIEDTRTYQTLQAKINCTIKSLISDRDIDNFREDRKKWKQQILELEAKGIR